MTRFSMISLTVAALVLASCGTDPDLSDGDGSTGEPPVAAVCGAYNPNCNDTVVLSDDQPRDSDEPGQDDEPLFVEDEPTDGVTPRGSSGLVVGGGLTIPEALSTEATGVLAVKGFFVSDVNGTRLCELLAESFPPQCAGESIVVHGLVVTELGPVQLANGVEWTDDVVTVFGEFADGALVVSGNVSG